MKPIFWLGCYGCIFHGTGNSAQLWQNFGISGGGLNPNSYPLGTPLETCSLFGMLHCIKYSVELCWQFYTNVCLLPCSLMLNVCSPVKARQLRAICGKPTEHRASVIECVECAQRTTEVVCCCMSQEVEWLHWSSVCVWRHVTWRRINSTRTCHEKCGTQEIYPVLS
jgi:hypothetical protein